MSSIESISNDLSEEDLLLFSAWYEQEIPKRYPLSTKETLDSIISVHKLGNDPAGYFTLSKTIWKGASDSSEVLAFTVATEKRGGSVKFGPTLVAEGLRGQGVGSKFRLLVEQVYARRGFRKSYSTTHLRNTAGIRYLARIGHSIEAHLRDHYLPGIDEVVLGRRLTSEETQVTCASLVPDAHLTAEDAHMLRELSQTYDELDESFMRQIRKTLRNELPLQEECEYVAKFKLMVTVSGDTAAITTPKRTGVIKITPLIYGAEELLSELLSKVEERYRSERHVRKLFGLFSHYDLSAIRILEKQGYNVEGYLREPYRRGLNMLIYSKRIEA